MKKIITLSIFIILVSSFKIYAQDYNSFKAIDKDIWSNFQDAFKTLNHELFESLHDSDFIRANGNAKEFKNKTEYISGYRDHWTNTSISQKIEFRFIERFNNNKLASERGIYKLTIDPDTVDARVYYGKFHVLIENIDGLWKLIVDYDSNENGAIGEVDFLNAHAMYDYNKY